MSLSSKVKDELMEAQSHLKNALTYAARNESSMVIKSISDLIFSLESIEKFDNVMEKLQNRKPGDSGSFGSFFMDFQ